MGVLPGEYHDDYGEEQRERNVDADDDRAAQIAKEYPLDHEDQAAAVDEVAQHRAGGLRYQCRAIVIRNELHTRRQRTVAVQLRNLVLDQRYDVVGVISPSHDHDCERDIVIVIFASDAKPRHVADRNFGDIFYLHRHAVRLREPDILDIVNVPALRQVAVAAAIEQTDATDIH